MCLSAHAISVERQSELVISLKVQCNLTNYRSGIRRDLHVLKIFLDLIHDIRFL